MGRVISILIVLFCFNSCTTDNMSSQYIDKVEKYMNTVHEYSWDRTNPIIFLRLNSCSPCTESVISYLIENSTKINQVVLVITGENEVYNDRLLEIDKLQLRIFYDKEDEIVRYRTNIGNSSLVNKGQITALDYENYENVLNQLQ